MSKFQELVVGLLALRHPEMFSLRFRPNSKPTAKIERSCDRGAFRSMEALHERDGRLSDLA